jgi:hypothetical protein
VFKFQAVITGMVATVLLNVLMRETRGHDDSYSTVSLIDFKIRDMTVMTVLKETHYRFIIEVLGLCTFPILRLPYISGFM